MVLKKNNSTLFELNYTMNEATPSRTQGPKNVDSKNIDAFRTSTFQNNLFGNSSTVTKSGIEKHLGAEAASVM